MKKIIALLLTLSLLLCTNAIVLAAEGDDSGNEPLTMVENVSETGVEPTTETDDRADPTDEPAETEATEPTEESDETETNVSSGDSETSDTTEPAEESTVPEDTAPAEDSETSQEPTDTVSDGDTKPADGEEITQDGDAEIDSPMAVADTYNIKIEWTGLVFTYHEATRGRWDPNNEGGPAWVEPQPAHWTSSDPSNNDCGTLTITNNVDELKSVKATIKFAPESQWGEYKVGLIMSETESEVTTTDPDNSNIYWSSSKSKPVQIQKGEAKKVYVRPGVSTDTLSNATFKGMQESSPTLFGNITITINPDINDPEYSEQPGTGDPASPEQPGME